ncbi:sulfatase-like hydrolase/transferase, partial [Candidatus Sumerlaeota bacterium]|nr:sulfatase-like hydrolase/transferase [Candidatus Sumerlaeota bacterium]
YLDELLDAWDKEIGLKDSLVIFFSDHGDHLRDPGYEGTFDLSKPSEEPYHLDLPLLDHGNSMDEILLHVPLVIHYPEAWGLKGVSEEQVSLVDLFPTILDGLKIAPVAPGNSITSSALHLDGRSLLHPIKDGSPPFIHADYQLYGDEMSSVRQGPFNYVINHHNGDQYLIDTRLPLDGKAEPASRVSNPEMQTRLEEEYKRYEAAAKAATKDLRSDVDIDQSEMTSELEKSGYFAGKSGGIQTPTASPKN